MYKKIVKRVLDFIMACVMVIPFVIVYMFVAIAIKIDDRGPVFYNVLRLGKDGKIYKMYKFRSMKVNAEDIRNADGSTYNGEDDPRLTRVGKFIRKTSIDELPQIINVLIGNMSFIGPRPDLPEHMKLYTDSEKRKLEVLPGITGYNQAYYRNSVEWKDRIKNDIYYIDNMSFLLDVKVVLKTISILVRLENVYINETKEEGEN